jgi:hypothetical protein
VGETATSLAKRSGLTQAGVSDPALRGEKKNKRISAGYKDEVIISWTSPYNNEERRISMIHKTAQRSGELFRAGYY